jgi:hypothetical protein
MAFPPQRDHRIPLEAAAALTRRYRNSHAKDTERAVLFPRDVFERLLNLPGARGIRFYYGQDTDGGPTRLVAVAVDESGNDIVTGELDDFGAPCPPFCSSDNPLNS